MKFVPSDQPLLRTVFKSWSLSPTGFVGLTSLSVRNLV